MVLGYAEHGAADATHADDEAADLPRGVHAVGVPFPRRVSGAIVRAARYCIDAMWVAEKATFRYTSCPYSSSDTGADMRILKGVAAAYRFSGDERLREVLLAGARTAMADERLRPQRGVGKSVCALMRGAPQVLLGLEQVARAEQLRQAQRK